MTTPAGAVNTPGAIRFGRALPVGPEIIFSPSIGFIASRLAKLDLDIRSFRVPLTRSIQQVMIPSIRKNFESESARNAPGAGGDWEPLSDFSLEMRDRGLVRFDRGGASGSKILDSTGALKRKATQLNLWTIDREKAEVQDLPDSVWYGKVQQSGYPAGTTTISRGVTASQLGASLRELGNIKQGKTAPDIPARPFLVIQPEDEDKIKDVFTVWLTERVAATMKW